MSYNSKVAFFNFKNISFIKKGPFFSFLGIIFFGYLALYSASNGSISPWAKKHMIYTLLSVPIFISIVSVNPKKILDFSYLFYFISICLLFAVFVAGKKSSLGGQRWLDLKIFHLQPSEIAKLGIILATARYYEKLKQTNIVRLIIVPILILIPAASLIVIQPDLTTAIIISVILISMLFFFIPDLRILIAPGVLILVSIPFIWMRLKKYQQLRVLNFLNPDLDPLGSGYNIIQSKIAIGSGGFFGTGILGGNQAQLGFLPEHHSDFIFTLIAEETGFLGVVIFLTLYTILIRYGYQVLNKSTSIFNKVVCIGIVNTYCLHLFINIGMTAGLLPAAGVPLPMVSYGGTMLVLSIIFFAILTNLDINYNKKYS